MSMSVEIIRKGKKIEKVKIYTTEKELGFEEEVIREISFDGFLTEMRGEEIIVFPLLVSNEEILQKLKQLDTNNEEAVDDFIDWILDNIFDENKAIDYISKHSEIKNGEVIEVDYPDAWSGGGIYIIFEGEIEEGITKRETWKIGYADTQHYSQYFKQPQLSNEEYHISDEDILRLIDEREDIIVLYNYEIIKRANEEGLEISDFAYNFIHNTEEFFVVYIDSLNSMNYIKKLLKAQSKEDIIKALREGIAEIKQKVMKR